MIVLFFAFFYGKKAVEVFFLKIPRKKVAYS